MDHHYTHVVPATTRKFTYKSHPRGTNLNPNPNLTLTSVALIFSGLPTSSTCSMKAYFTFNPCMLSIPACIPGYSSCMLPIPPTLLGSS